MIYKYVPSNIIPCTILDVTASVILLHLTPLWLNLHVPLQEIQCYNNICTVAGYFQLYMKKSWGIISPKIFQRKDYRLGKTLWAWSLDATSKAELWKVHNCVVHPSRHVFCSFETTSRALRCSIHCFEEMENLSTVFPLPSLPHPRHQFWKYLDDCQTVTTEIFPETDVKPWKFLNIENFDSTVKGKDVGLR